MLALQELKHVCRYYRHHRGKLSSLQTWSFAEVQLKRANEKASKPRQLHKDLQQEIDGQSMRSCLKGEGNTPTPLHSADGSCSHGKHRGSRLLANYCCALKHHGVWCTWCWGAGAGSAIKHFTAHRSPCLRASSGMKNKHKRTGRAG